MLYLFIWFSFFWFCCGLERAWAAAGIWPEMKTNGNSIREDANYPKDPDFLSWFAGCMRPPSLLPHPPPPPPSIVAFNCPIKLIWRDHSQVAWCSNGAAGNQIVGWLRRRHRGAMCWSCPASNNHTEETRRGGGGEGGGGGGGGGWKNGACGMSKAKARGNQNGSENEDGRRRRRRRRRRKK